MAEFTEEMAIQQWMNIASQVNIMVEQIGQDHGTLVVQPGSQLADDDAASDPYRVSHCARKCLNAGVDHMHALTTLILGVPVIHAASGYTLIRGALENFAAAFWILHPPEGRDRIEHTLRWRVKDYRDQDNATARLELANYIPLKTNLNRVVDVGVRAACKRGNVLRDYSSTEVLKYADKHTSISPSPYLMWQVCSGFAHGRQWASLAMNAAEIKPTSEDGVSSVRFTSDFRRLLGSGWPASELMTEVVRLFSERAHA